MEMSSRERLTCLFDGGIPDRVGSSFLINPYFTQSLPKKYEPLDLLKELGADILDRDCPLPYKKTLHKVDVRQETIGTDTRITYETNVGKVWETYAGTHAWGNIPFKKEHFIKSVEDYKIMEYIFENMSVEPYYDWFEERDRELGDAGIVTPQITEFRSSLEYLCEDDVEQTVYHLMDEPEIVRSFLNTLRQKNLELCQVAVHSPATVFNIWEDSSTTLISPSMFEEYVLPEFEAFTGIVNQAGKKLMHHACGHIKGLLELMKREDVAAIESITPYRTGNVSLQECAAVWGEKFLMIGGLDPVFLIESTVDELERFLVETLDSLGDLRKKVIIANGDSLPPGVSLEKLKLVVDVAKRYRFN